MRSAISAPLLPTVECSCWKWRRLFYSRTSSRQRKL